MRLRVYLHDRLAGRLANESGSLVFSYDEAYLAGPDAAALSLSLPLTPKPFSRRATETFFANLLPEADVLLTVSQVLRVSAQNVGGLLRELGGDFAGAITVEAIDDRPGEPGAPTRTLTARELDEILERLPTRPLGQDGESGELRLSLAGAQSKLPAIIEGDRFSLPIGSRAPTTHILKPEPARFPELVDNEWFCMRLAAAASFDVARVERGSTVDGLPYLIVERYDRDRSVAPVRRLHQEDFCQALGRPARAKYEKEGGPSAAEILELMHDHSVRPARDRQAFWDALVFNYLIGNCDAHGKNYSLLYDARAPRLAPLYDLVSTAAYEQLTTELAMRIGAARALGEVTWSSFAALAATAGFQPRWIARRTIDLAARIAQLAAALAEHPDHSTAREIANGIGVRARRLTEQGGP